jgi:imidazolonepropionase-like amidohydrolase
MALGIGAPGAPRIVNHGIVIENVTLISPERAAPLGSADVVIRDGRIAEIGTDLVAGGEARRIDGRGRYLIPGLVDSHVHVGNWAGVDAAVADDPALRQAYLAQLPRAYLAFGFTTLVDLDLRPRDRTLFDDAPLRPRLVHCGRGLRVAGGYGTSRIPADATTERFPYLVHEPAQATRWPAGLAPRLHTPALAIERAVAGGATCTKLFVEPGFGGTFDWPVPRPETVQAIRAETRRRRLPLFVHANGVEAWRIAIDNRADVIAHGLWHWPGDRSDAEPPAAARDVILAAARAGIAVQPTLRVVHGDTAVFDWSILSDPRLAYALPPTVVDHLRSESAAAARRGTLADYEAAAAGADVRQLIATGGERASATAQLVNLSGIRLLFGSDTGGGEGIANPPGLNGRLELQLWREAGIPLRQILRAATLANAEALGLAKEIGSIEVGKRADLLLLHADPLRDVGAYDRIETIFVDGQMIDRRLLRAGN